MLTSEDAVGVVGVGLRAQTGGETLVLRIEWTVDDMPVETPIGEWGSRLTADVELLVGKFKP